VRALWAKAFRILRLLIQDITVARTSEAKVTLLHIRWQGGATEDLCVTRPASAADQVRYPEEIVEQVRNLARSMSDAQVAEDLHRRGYRPPKGEAFNASMVYWIRYRHRIPAPPSRRLGEWSVQELAIRLGVRPGVVYYWIAQEVLRPSD
jgi:hypothetical protein